MLAPGIPLDCPPSGSHLVKGARVPPATLRGDNLEHEPSKRGQCWNPQCTMGEQKAIVVIARYLIRQELTASEGKRLIKRLSALKMAMKTRAPLIPLVLVPAHCLPRHGYLGGLAGEASWADRALLISMLREVPAIPEAGIRL